MLWFNFQNFCCLPIRSMALVPCMHCNSIVSVVILNCIFVTTSTLTHNDIDIRSLVTPTKIHFFQNYFLYHNINLYTCNSFSSAEEGPRGRNVQVEEVLVLWRSSITRLQYIEHSNESLQNYSYMLIYTGFQVETPAGQLTCRVAMLMSAVDLPARAIMANMKQFNGHYSCSWCEIEGISPPNLPMVSYFPYPLHKPTPRTNLRILVNAATATKENKSVSLLLFASI